MGLGSGSNRSGFLPYFIFILSVLFLFSCNKNVPGTMSKKDSDKPEMMAKSEKDKAMDSKASSGMKGDAAETKEDEDVAAMAATEHANLFIENDYPSATTCATCHPKHYKEWSVSQHSYAQLSPVYLFQSPLGTHPYYPEHAPILRRLWAHKPERANRLSELPNDHCACCKSCSFDGRQYR